MDSQKFDSLVKSLGADASRRGVLRGGVAAAIGALGLGIGSRATSAAPKTCVTCACGTGRPCNVKSSFCQEVRGFSAEQTCANACARRNQNLCGAGQAFHCPRGCPA